MTDAELLRLAQQGDRAAWNTLYDRCLPTLWSYVWNQTGGDLHGTEDIVAETMLAFARALDRFRPQRGTVAGWLVGIARRKLADHRRQRSRLVCSASTGQSVEAAHGADSASGDLETAELRAQVTAVLDQLTDDERVALQWKYVEDLSVAEIAGRLGKTSKAVESLLFRARRSFRTRFDQPQS